MPGVFRPYTLVDVLGTLNEQNQASGTAELVNGLGQFGEVDEAIPISDSCTASVQVSPTWDGGPWGQFTWA